MPETHVEKSYGFLQAVPVCAGICMDLPLFILMTSHTRVRPKLNRSVVVFDINYVFSWTDLCQANNQWNIESDLGSNPMDSAFARALTSGIKGVAMVVDQEVQPLTSDLDHKQNETGRSIQSQTG